MSVFQIFFDLCFLLWELILRRFRWEVILHRFRLFTLSINVIHSHPIVAVDLIMIDFYCTTQKKYRESWM